MWLSICDREKGWFMAYWRELPENFTSGWDLSQISATNLMLTIAPKKTGY